MGSSASSGAGRSVGSGAGSSAASGARQVGKSAGWQQCRQAGSSAGRQAAAVQAGSHLLETSSSTATFPGCLARGFPADEDLAGMTTLCSPSIVTRGPGWVGEEVKGVWGGSSGLVVCWSY